MTRPRLTISRLLAAQAVIALFFGFYAHSTGSNLDFVLAVVSSSTGPVLIILLGRDWRQILVALGLVILGLVEFVLCAIGAATVPAFLLLVSIAVVLVTLALLGRIRYLLGEASESAPLQKIPNAEEPPP